MAMATSHHWNDAGAMTPRIGPHHLGGRRTNGASGSGRESDEAAPVPPPDLDGLGHPETNLSDDLEITLPT